MAVRVDLAGIGKGWQVQRRVIFALLMREIMTRFGRHNIGFLWLFVEPMIFTLGIATLWSATKVVHGSTLPIVPFAITGYSSVLLWRNMATRCIGAVQPNLSLLNHRYVKVFDIFAARNLLEAMGASSSFLVLTLFFNFIGWTNLPEDILQLLTGWFLLMWLGAGLATLLGALSEKYETVEKLWHPAAYLLFPLSGAAFTVDALPQIGQDLILYIPMVNAVELIREGFFGTQFHPHYSIPYLLLWCIGLTILALAQTRILGEEVVPE